MNLFAFFVLQISPNVDACGIRRQHQLEHTPDVSSVEATQIGLWSPQ